MRRNPWVSIRGVAGVIAVLSMGACGSSKDDTSSLSLELTGGVFDGNSVRISAHRDGAADSKYPCFSDAVGCFNFGTNSRGVPTPAPGDTGAASFLHLCPTNDVNDPNLPGTGTWTFTYQIFNQPNCMGAELTADMHNFTCYEPSDLVLQNHPNQTKDETLRPGFMINTVLCVSTNTQKYFDFTACEELPSLIIGHPVTFDCGCTTTTSGACNCPFDTSTLPGGGPDGHCNLDSRCNITCCGDSLTACKGSCVDTNTDNDNCGACGHACPSSQTCTGGVCTCINYMGTGCYWQETGSGAFCWVRASGFPRTIPSCQNLDSCSPNGGGASGGGCYRWADCSLCSTIYPNPLWP
jgi:hypothetical protein